MSICNVLFNEIEIHETGEVYTCCPWYINFYSIGNIYNAPFDEIWNSEKAIKFREKILAGDYSLCNSEFCDTSERCSNIIPDEEMQNYKTTMIKYPTYVKFCIDKTCNIKCTICRDELYYNPPEHQDFLNSKIEEVYLPMLKDAHTVMICGSGEPFASQHSIALIKAISNSYPDIKFEFHTNGILCDEELLTRLGVIDKISKIAVSMHSATEETYNKIAKGGNFNKVIKNLASFSKMKTENKIDYFRLIFVVYSENYQEMVEFAELARKNNAIAQFWPYMKNNTELGNEYEKHAIWEAEHADNHKLIEILKNPIFDSDFVILSPQLSNLKSK